MIEHRTCNVVRPITTKFSYLMISLKKFSDGSNYVRSSMFDRSKPKIGCSSSITNRWTCSSSFDVQKNDVQVSSMSNLVNIVKALLSSMFEFLSFEAKNRVFEFDPQYMNTFEFVRCSKIDVRVRSIKWCSTHHYLPCMQRHNCWGKKW